MLKSTYAQLFPFMTIRYTPTPSVFLLLNNIFQLSESHYQRGGGQCIPFYPTLDIVYEIFFHLFFLYNCLSPKVNIWLYGLNNHFWLLVFPVPERIFYRLMWIWVNKGTRGNQIDNIGSSLTNQFNILVDNEKKKQVMGSKFIKYFLYFWLSELFRKEWNFIVSSC